MLYICNWFKSAWPSVNKGERETTLNYVEVLQQLQEANVYVPLENQFNMQFTQMDHTQTLSHTTFQQHQLFGKFELR